MRRYSILVVALFGLGWLSGLSTSAREKPDDKPSCGHYGTSVEFYSSPSEAARKAKEEQKLVFVLHVSGHFEDPKFT